MPQPRRYRLIDHTADFGLRIWGRTLSELYVNAAEGMCTLMFNLPAVQPHQQRTIIAQGYDREEVLVDWLGQLLYLAETEEFLPCRFDIVELDDIHLRAEVLGELFDPERHYWAVGIKAATYHDLHIEQTSRGEWTVQVILDT